MSQIDISQLGTGTSVPREHAVRAIVKVPGQLQPKAAPMTALLTVHFQLREHSECCIGCI